MAPKEKKTFANMFDRFAKEDAEKEERAKWVDGTKIYQIINIEMGHGLPGSTLSDPIKEMKGYFIGPIWPVKTRE